MSFVEQRDTLNDAAFELFGLAALWGGSQPVLVRLRSTDQDVKFSNASVIRRVTKLRVRNDDVAQPAVGDTVMVTEGPEAGTYQIKDRPMRDRRGVWDCPVEVVA